MLSDLSFLRYQRQICLPEVGEQGQQNLLNASVLVIGCGGLGNTAAMHLAAAGVGKLVICDDDIIEVSNLTRQIAFHDKHISRPKVEVLAEQLRAQNPDCHIRTVGRRMDESLLPLEVTMADVVLDCSDNITTRHHVNQACYKAQVPLVSGAAIGWVGQLIAFDYRKMLPDQGCYACMVPNSDSEQVSKCSDLGVIGPVVGTIGNMQALLAMQILFELHEIQTNQLVNFDGKTLRWDKWKLFADPECPVCGNSRQSSLNNMEELC